MSFPYDLLCHGVSPGALPSSYHITPLNTPIPSIQHLLHHIRKEPLPQLPPYTSDNTPTASTPAEVNLMALTQTIQHPWPGLTNEQDTTHESAEEFAERMKRERSKKQKLRLIEILSEHCSQLDVDSMLELLSFVEGFAREMRGYLKKGNEFSPAHGTE